MKTTPPKPTHYKIEQGFSKKLNILFQLDKQKFKYFLTLLEKGIITQPATLVNVFGGDIESLLLKIMALEPSYFLYDTIELTEKLIIFSRLELKIEFNTKSIKASNWLHVMKDDAYNSQFMTYQKSSFNKMKSIFRDRKFTFVMHEYISTMQRLLTTWLSDHHEEKSQGSRLSYTSHSSNALNR